MKLANEITETVISEYREERCLWDLKILFYELGHYATSRKVAGSISDEVIGFFILPSALWHWAGLSL
jgi:hypothetical protein